MFALGCLGRVCAFVMFADVVGVFVVWWVDWIGVLAGGFGNVVVCGVNGCWVFGCVILVFAFAWLRYSC